ncbi:MAG: hypothetical protein U0Q16_13650 [Bryobacteraceae bacterium]
MNRLARLTLIALTAFATLFAAEQTTNPPAQPEIPAATPTTEAPAANDEMKPILDSIGAIGAIIGAAGKENQQAAEAKKAEAATNDAQPFDNPEAEILKNETKPAASQTGGEPKVAKKRSIQKTLALITAGAAAGAAIGSQATKDKQKGAIMGAVAGSIAALIYDRVTAKNPPGGL